MSLFIKKPLEQLLAQAADSGKALKNMSTLQKTFSDEILTLVMKYL